MDDELIAVFEQTKTIAVVGASATPGKHAHRIPAYLQSQGYRMIPINPSGAEILGEQAVTSLEDVDVPIDVVEVFRPPAEAESVARAAIDAGARVLWFQPGTHTEEAVQLATDAGVFVVAGRCMGTTHGHLGLGPGP